nr:immunoglobulin light chain junction region [Macaca mulatta]
DYYCGVWDTNLSAYIF